MTFLIQVLITPICLALLKSRKCGDEIRDSTFQALLLKGSSNYLMVVVGNKYWMVMIKVFTQVYQVLNVEILSSSSLLFENFTWRNAARSWHFERPFVYAQSTIICQGLDFFTMTICTDVCTICVYCRVWRLSSAKVLRYSCFTPDWLMVSTVND